MAENTQDIGAPPERVWQVLSNGKTYADWVVGAKEIRDVDTGWPAVGTRLHHSVGTGPVKIKDITEVVEVKPLHKLALRAAVRPIGIANVTFELTGTPEGTHVVMKEVVVGGPAARFYGSLMSKAIHARNMETLRRLKKLAEDPAE